MIKKVFVTGGAGFIGSTVVRQLISSGYQVTVFDNLSTGTIENLPSDKAVRFISGDVKDFEMISSVMRGHEYVIHLAAQAFIPLSYDFPESISRTNALGSLNVFKSCINNGVKRIVHVSSSEVYGAAIYTPMDEQHPLNPASTYAVAKLAADLWAQTMAFEHRLPIVILRPFNTFGPKDTCPRFIPEVIRQCFKEITIKIGNIDSYRDYTYVEDVARAIISALEKEKIEGEIINVGTGKTWKMSKILEMIKSNTGNENKEVLQDTKRLRPKDVPLLMSSTAKAFRMLGWKPEVEFSEGLQKTIEWYRKNGGTWNYEKRGWNGRYEI